jgi:hypothetical protein
VAGRWCSCEAVIAKRMPETDSERARDQQRNASQVKCLLLRSMELWMRAVYIKNLPNQPSTCSLDAIYSYCLRLRSVATAAAHGKRRRVRPIRARRRGEAGRLDAVR